MLTCEFYTCITMFGCFVALESQMELASGFVFVWGFFVCFLVLVLIFQCVSIVVLEAGLDFSFVPVNDVHLFLQLPSFTSEFPKNSQFGQAASQKLL